MAEPPAGKHASFEIVFHPHFSDNAATLLAKLKDDTFLQGLISDSEQTRQELLALGIEVKGKDKRLVDHDRELAKLKEELGKFRPREHKNPPQLGWCKIKAIAAAATEAA